MIIKITKDEHNKFVEIIDKLKGLSAEFEKENFKCELRHAFLEEGKDKGLNVSNNDFIDNFYPIVITLTDRFLDEVDDVADSYDWLWESYNKLSSAGQSSVISVDDFDKLVTEFGKH